TGAVGRGVVVAEDVQLRAAERRVDGARDQVDLRMMILAELSVRIRAGGVEVSKGRPAQSAGALEVRQRALHGELALAVRIDGLLWMGLGDGGLDRLAVGRARRGEHE